MRRASEFDGADFGGAVPVEGLRLDDGGEAGWRGDRPADVGAAIRGDEQRPLAVVAVKYTVSLVLIVLVSTRFVVATAVPLELVTLKFVIAETAMFGTILIVVGSCHGIIAEVVETH